MSFFFFFNDTATTEIYTLSLHDALPICHVKRLVKSIQTRNLLHLRPIAVDETMAVIDGQHRLRSEEHTSELQSPDHLVCRLLLEKKKKKRKTMSKHIPTLDTRIACVIVD